MLFFYLLQKKQKEQKHTVNMILCSFYNILFYKKNEINYRCISILLKCSQMFFFLI